jgi:hypothetical protein
MPIKLSELQYSSPWQALTVAFIHEAYPELYKKLGLDKDIEWDISEEIEYTDLSALE